MATDARRKEVYLASYDEDGPASTGPSSAGRPTLPPSCRWWGRAALLYPEAFPRATGPDAPSAGWLARVITERARRAARPRAALPAPARRRDARGAQAGLVSGPAGHRGRRRTRSRPRRRDNLGADAWSPGLVAEGVAGRLPTVHYLVAEAEAAWSVTRSPAWSPTIAELQRIAVAAGHRRRRRGRGAARRGGGARRASADVDRLLLEVREDNAARAAPSTPRRGSSRWTAGRGTTGDGGDRRRAAPSRRTGVTDRAQ